MRGSCHAALWAGVVAAASALSLGAAPIPADVPGRTARSAPDSAFHDLGVDEIRRPSQHEDTVPFSPLAHIVNVGNVDESCIPVYFRISGPAAGVFYFDSAFASVSAGQALDVAFPVWGGHHAQIRYLAVCSTALADDVNPENDTQRKVFQVGGTAQPRWFQSADLPAGPRGKKVRDGGALTCRGIGDSLYVWALKGSNSSEFYRYDIHWDRWQAMESLPVASRVPGAHKRVKSGSALAAGGDGMIYAVKGNRSTEFWQYDPGARHWVEKASVPLGSRALGKGTAMAGAAIGSDHFIYLLKGSGTNEFYRYRIAVDTWERMADAPAGPSGRGYQAGSSLAWDSSAGLLYALKGSYNEFYAYNPLDDTWYTRAMLPFVGFGRRSKRCKDGAGLAGLGGAVYALKGNGTGEFWYHVESPEDHWVQAQDVPMGTRGVKAGGSICASMVPGNQFALFALKGNNTSEFYQHMILPQPGGMRPADAPAGNWGTLGLPSFAITPNPFVRTTTVSFSMPKGGSAVIRLYDAAGRQVSSFCSGRCKDGVFSARIDAANLAPGVYLVRFDCQGYSARRKLILAK